MTQGMAACISVFSITVVEFIDRGEAFYTDSLESAIHLYTNASPLHRNFVKSLDLSRDEVRVGRD